MLLGAWSESIGARFAAFVGGSFAELGGLAGSARAGQTSGRRGMLRMPSKHCGSLFYSGDAMTTPKKFAAFAREQLRPILNRSGKVLYSAATTLKPGKVYLLGINPGGDEVGQAQETIGEDLDRLPRRTENAYLDEQWRRRDGGGSSLREAGTAPLQVRVRWLLENLGLKPGEVAASNLVFVRSRTQEDVIEKFADQCWPVHVRILEIVKPRLVIVYGGGTFRYLREQHMREQRMREKSLRRDGPSCPAGHGNWKCSSFESTDGFRVVGLPHLSRYDIRGKDEVIRWLRECSV